MLAATLAGLALASGAAADAGGRYLLELELSARQAGGRGRGELMAGARLLMTAHRSDDGTLSLSFERALEHPWKLFHVDPRGPFGRQTKIASVITLTEASWEALDAGRDAQERLAAERYARWQPASGRKPPFDGSFAFVVIGPAEGRFTVEVAADGGALRIENRLTDRWLNGDFDRFVGSWGAEGARPAAPRGYWFWNHGEAEPFSWQPRTYRGLAAALELLGREPERAGELLRGAGRVVEALAPDSSLRQAVSAPPLEIERRDEVGPAGETSVVHAARGAATAFERRTRFVRGAVVADRLEIEIERRRAGLRLAVGYRPVDLEETAPWNR